jgi:hypothetical protein
VVRGVDTKVGADNQGFEGPLSGEIVVSDSYFGDVVNTGPEGGDEGSRWV